MTGSTKAAALVACFMLAACAQTTTPGACPAILTPSYSRPVVAGGWIAQLVATNLSNPRSILFDQSGALLVVEQRRGIRRLTFNDNGGTCLSVKDNAVLVGDGELNHGLQLSPDGKTLYASSRDSVYSYSYDSAAATTSGRTTLISNMTSGGHSTRTILLSGKSPNTMLVSRGSDGNIDALARVLSSGHSHIRAFDISNLPDGKAHEYSAGGKLIGWGLRNSVGIAEDPSTGAIYSVENSADQMRRNGVDIHQDNPGEELNYHGFLNGSTESQGGNYGYPDCFALWSTAVPELGAMNTGSQFAVEQTDSVNDRVCAEKYVAPRLTFQAHTAPLDILFSPDGSEAFITFHGSWNRDEPAGYKLSSIAFKNGHPVAPPNSTTASRDIMSNPDLRACPGRCFRPVGLAWDSKGRLFMSSDSTGEIYVLQRAEMTTLDGGGNPSQTPLGTGTLVTGETNRPNAATRTGTGEQGIVMLLAAAGMSVVAGAMLFAA